MKKVIWLLNRVSKVDILTAQDEPLLNKIKKDCERKVAFLNNQTTPAYLSSPPKDIDSSPYGIASLANTMPPPKKEGKGENILVKYNPEYLSVRSGIK